MRDLVITQGQAILALPEQFKHFQILSRETNFYFRAEMAEALGNIQFKDEKRPNLMSKEEFQKSYYDELIELTGDIDNMVKAKAFESISKLVSSDECERDSILDEQQLADDIMPVFLKLIETVLDDEDGMQHMSQMFGRFVYNISRKFEHLIMDNA